MFNFIMGLLIGFIIATVSLDPALKKADEIITDVKEFTQK